MRRITSLFFALLLTGVLVSPALADNGHGHGRWHGPIWGYNGQANENGQGRSFNAVLVSGSAAAGQADPNVTVTPAGGTSQSAVVCATTPTPPWANPLPHSNWISLQADCTTSLANSTNYQYTTTFTLPANHPGVWISGRVLADDSVTIQLNGNTIFTGGNFSSATSFSSHNAAFFTTGTNTLTFTVNNVTGPSGLDYVARVHAGRGLLNLLSRLDRDNDRGE